MNDSQPDQSAAQSAAESVPQSAQPEPQPEPRPAAQAAPQPAAEPAPQPAAEPAAQWGRVAEDGSVFVRTADGERQVGQMPGATPEEALAFYTKRYDDLAFEVQLLEQRINAGALAPDEATHAVDQVHAGVETAQAVGDLAALDRRLEAMRAAIEKQREQRRAERAKRVAEARGRKERIAAEAEALAAGDDWRNGANRLRDLLEEWKALPRIDKSTDDTLWRRFSTARTTYTRRRKAHFAELGEKREAARAVKERLVVEAEALADSTDWGPTAGRYRDLMRQWKAAGPAPKNVDDQLWKRFRAAQDQFFGARDAENAKVDAEYAANAEVKEKLLTEAEALLPVTDVRVAKEAFRDIAERWDAAGRVPRDRIKELEGRMRRVEQAIRGVEDDQWKRSNPEARARAADTVAQLESSLRDLEDKKAKAEASGNDKKAAEYASAIETRQAWLVEARKALEDFSA